MKDIAKQVREFMEREDIKAQFEADLASIISIPSVSEKGEGKYVFGENCARVLDTTLAIGEKYGFKSENHDYYCGSLIYGEGEKEIGIVSHLDVVPCGGGWSVEPYALTVKDGLYIGRGTEDDKGPMLISMYAIRFLMEKGYSLPFAVRMILGCDEEVGSTDLRHFASVREVPDFSFTPDSGFPVCIGEKGIFSFGILLGEKPANILEIGGGTASNSVADSAYCVVKTDVTSKAKEGITVENMGDTLRITATGKGAHASLPENSLSAVKLLCEYLVENGIADTEGLRFLAKACSEYKGKTFGIDKEDKDFGYLTCICGLLGEKEGKLWANFNVRYIPYVPYEEIIATVKQTAESYGFTAYSGGCSEGYIMSSDDPRIQALTDSCRDIIEEDCAPYTMGGGTYARYMKNTVAFGATISAYRGLLGEGKGGAHERDEYISREEVIRAAQIFVLSLLRLKKVYSGN